MAEDLPSHPHSRPADRQPGIYQPLPHTAPSDKAEDSPFRTLVLEPGKYDDDIVCTLTATTIAQAVGAYTAISYVWGDLSEYSRVYIANREAYLPITTSLDVLLRHLRFEDQARHLWIDQICINQEDLDERAQQVTRMWHIFGNAECVLSWLGPDWGGSAKLFDFLRQLSSFDKTHDQAAIKDFLEAEVEAMWPDIQALDRSEYFYRTWVAMEMSVNEKSLMLCGSNTLEWEQLTLALHYLLKWFPLHLLLASSDYYFNSIWCLCSTRTGHRMHTRPGSYNSLLHRLRSLQNNRATDARDKVSTTTVRDVYIQVVKSCLNSGQLHELLASRWNSYSEYDLPSWCPNWTSSGETTPLSFEKAPVAVAGNTTNAVLQDGVLSMTGLVLDSVEQVLDTTLVWEHDLPLRKDLEGLQQTVASLSSSGISDRAFWRTIVAGCDWQSPSSLGVERQGFERCWSAYMQATLDSSSPNPLPETVWFSKCINYSLTNRCVCITSGGRIGLAREDVKSGDKLCVLFGGSVPYCLRPRGDRYEFMGQSYLDDFMNGEAIEAMGKGLFEAQTFHLV